MDKEKLITPTFPPTLVMARNIIAPVLEYGQEYFFPGVQNKY
jgi:hypothetical protein